MNYLEHEFLVPIFLGNGKEALDIAKNIKKVNKARAHLFAPRFKLFQKIRFDCHKVSPWRNRLLLISLLDFAVELEEYKHPVLIYGELNKDFISSNLEELESRFRVISYGEIVRILEENTNEF